MKQRALVFLSILACFMMPFSASAQSTQEWVGAGLEFVGRTLSKRDARNTPSDNTAAGQAAGDNQALANLMEDAAATLRKTRPQDGEERTGADRLADALDVFARGLRDGKELSVVIRESCDVVLNEYSERFKAEGRAYAVELAGNMAERACADPKISSTLWSIRLLCWGVVIYLSLVTLYLVYTVYRLRRTNKRLAALIEEKLRDAAPQSAKKLPPPAPNTQD